MITWWLETRGGEREASFILCWLISRQFNWKICDYLKKTKVSYTKLLLYLDFLSRKLVINKPAIHSNDSQTFKLVSATFKLFCNLHGYLVFLILACAFTKLLLNEIYTTLRKSIWFIWLISFIRYYSSLNLPKYYK